MAAVCRLLLGLLMVLAASNPVHSADLPNIVMLFADDVSVLLLI